MVDVASDSSWESLVCCRPLRIASAATAIHRIQDAEMDDAPSLAAAMHAMVAFVDAHTPPGHQPLLLAHNGETFDFRVLRSNLAALQPAKAVPDSWLFVDTYRCGGGAGASLLPQIATIIGPHHPAMAAARAGWRSDWG